VDQFVALEVARLDRPEATLVALRLGAQHRGVEIGVAKLGVVLGAQVVVRHVVQVDEGPPAAHGVEGEEVEVDEAGEHGQGGEQESVGRALEGPRQLQVAQQQEQSRGRGQQELDPLEMDEVARAVKELVDDRGLKSIAICFLFS